MSRPDYDICVIGAGSGGLSVAAAAAQFGEKVVLIERGKKPIEVMPGSASSWLSKHCPPISGTTMRGLMSSRPRRRSTMLCSSPTTSRL